MNYLKRFYYTLLCLNLTASTNCNNNTTHDLVRKLNLIISKNREIWDHSFQFRRSQVLDGGQFVKLKDYLNDSLKLLDFIKTDYSNHVISSKNKASLFEMLNSIYTFFKCEYAGLVGQLLKFIYKSLKSCQLIKHTTNTDEKMKECIDLTLINFNKTKPYIVKAIFNLFNFNDLSENLKSSDQTLLVSLLTINTFLYSSDIKKELLNYMKSSRESDIKDEKFIYIDDAYPYFDKLVTQLMYSLKNFTCKYCQFTFNTLDYTNVQPAYYSKIKSGNEFTDFDSAIKSFMDTHYLIHIEKLNGFKFESVVVDIDDDMYDSKYLLLKEIFTIESGFQSLLMEFGMKTKKTTIEIVKDVATSFNIKKVLTYHIYLIEFIRSIFSVQIKNLTLSTNNCFEKQAFDKLKTLVDFFVEFTDNLIPDNYPPILFNFINVIKNALLADLNQSESNNVLLSDKTLQLLMSNSMISTDKNNVHLYLEISMSNLIEKIVGFHNFKSFKQTFEILLQESNTLDDYYLIKADNQKEIEDSYRITIIDTGTCTLLPVIRECILLFWSLIEIIETQINNKLKLQSNKFRHSRSQIDENYLLQDYLTPSFDNMFEYMAHVYKNTNDVRLQTIFLPLLVHFQNTEWILYRNYEQICKKNSILKRTLLLAANAIQFYQVNKCNGAEDSQSIMEKISKYTRDKRKINIINNIHTKIVLKTRIYNYKSFEIRKYISGVIDAYIFSNYLDITNVTYLSNVSLLWHGLKRSVLNVSHDVAQNVVDHQYILRFQTLMLHYLFAKIYVNLDYIFNFPKSLTKSRITEIQKYLEGLNFYKYSLPLALGLQDIFQLYLKIFENEDISEKSIKLFKNQIDYRLRAYGVFEIKRNHKFKTFSDCYAALKNDIKTLKKYFMHAPLKELLIFVDDYAVPMIWKNYTVV